MAGANRVVIGRVTGPHGIHGALKIFPLTDYPERFFGMKSISLYRGGELAGTWPVTDMGELRGRGLVLCSLAGVDSVEAAEMLSGCTVEVDPSGRVPLPENEFWIDDLVGLEARDESGRRLGTVKDIVSSGAARLLVITDDGGAEHLIPAVPEFFLSADLATRTVTVRLIDGLWEL